MTLTLERPEAPPAEGRTRAPTWVFRGVIVLLFGLLIAQLWRLQVVDGAALGRRSADNWLRQAPIEPQRGVIYDRNKTLLASNAPIFVVSITPADVPRGRLDEIEIRLANELRVMPDEIRRVVSARQTRKS